MRRSSRATRTSARSCRRRAEPGARRTRLLAFGARCDARSSWPSCRPSPWWRSRRGGGATRRPARPLAAAADELVAKGVPGVLVRSHEGDERGRARAGALRRRTSDSASGASTKTFVAVARAHAGGRGVLSLDDPVSRYVPGLLRDGDRVTVRRAARPHRRPLRLHARPEAPRRRPDPARSSSRSPMPGRGATATRTRARTTSPSASCSRRATGEPLAELLRREVFEPYGLATRAFEPWTRERRLPPRERARLPRRCRDRAAPRHGSRNARSAWAAAAAVSTASDLDRFFTRLLHSDLGRRMRPREGTRYGLGLARFQTDCGPVVGHTGNLLGTVTVVGARGDRLLVVAVNVYPLEPPQEAALAAPARPWALRLRSAAMSRCCD